MQKRIEPNKLSPEQVAALPPVYRNKLLRQRALHYARRWHKDVPFLEYPWRFWYLLRMEGIARSQTIIKALRNPDFPNSRAREYGNRLLERANSPELHYPIPSEQALSEQV